jgi:hypothetical protein
MSVSTARDVQAKAQLALSSSPVYALRELVVEHDGQTLVLNGVVTSFYHKQLAQEIVRQALEHDEVEADVVNEIKVL